MMTENEERDFETFALASSNVPKRKTLWRASQENTKFYSQAQQVHRQDDSFISQAQYIDSQALTRDEVDQAKGQARPLLDHAQASAQDQPQLVRLSFQSCCLEVKVSHLQFWYVMAI